MARVFEVLPLSSAILLHGQQQMCYNREVFCLTRNFTTPKFFKSRKEKLQRFLFFF